MVATEKENRYEELVARTISILGEAQAIDENSHSPYQ